MEGNPYAAPPPPPRKKGGFGTAQIIALLAITGILGTLGYKALRGTPGSFLAPPAEYQLQYLPADFKMNIDTETALAILRNPRR